MTTSNGNELQSSSTKRPYIRLANPDAKPSGILVQVPGEESSLMPYFLYDDSGAPKSMAAAEVTFIVGERPGNTDEDECDALVSLPKLLRGLSMTVQVGKELEDDQFGLDGLVAANAVFEHSYALVSDAVSSTLSDELLRLIGDVGGERSLSELRLLYAQLASWGNSVLASAQQSIALAAQESTLG